MLKSINVIGKCEGYSMVVHYIMMNFSYEESMESFEEQGYYVPKDLFLAIKTMLDITIDLDIGFRQEERTY